MYLLTYFYSAKPYLVHAYTITQLIPFEAHRYPRRGVGWAHATAIVAYVRQCHFGLVTTYSYIYCYTASCTIIINEYRYTYSYRLHAFMVIA